MGAGEMVFARCRIGIRAGAVLLDRRRTIGAAVDQVPVYLLCRGIDNRGLAVGTRSHVFTDVGRHQRCSPLEDDRCVGSTSRATGSAYQWPSTMTS